MKGANILLFPEDGIKDTTLDQPFRRVGPRMLLLFDCQVMRLRLKNNCDKFVYFIKDLIDLRLDFWLDS